METKVAGVSAIVEFDYTANEPDEISLSKGDLITNIKTQPGGWWQGTVATSGKTGMFPDNFVKLLDSNSDDKVILRDKASAKNRRCKVIYSYKENKEDELTLAVGDLIEVFEEIEEGWWKGKLGNKVGVFPSNFVEIIDSVSPKSTNRKSINNTILQNKINNNNRSSITNSREDLVNNTSGGNIESADVPSLPPKPIREQCKVLYAYAPVNEDELKLNEGDIVTIINKDLPDKGWWKGELRGKSGVFPDNFVTILPSESSPITVKERPPIGTKTIINATSASVKSSTQSYRKDSFGSKDSLNDSNNLINTERNSGIFGNVAAHRRSLENKSHENHTIEKPPRKSLIITDANKTPSDIRKSLENLDDKKSTPPPVLTKKPTVPIKKSPSVSTVATSIFSGLKQKVKSVESKLHTATPDGIDGVGSSKTSASQVADNSEKGVVGEKLNDLDTVERGSYLQDVRQNRAKAPKRRPPTSAVSIVGDSNNNVNMNGSHPAESNDPSSLTNENSSPAHNQNDDEQSLPPPQQLAKPRTREWEKHKAPWMEELKANQIARKTSPNVEHKLGSPDDEKHDLSKSFSSSFSQKKSAISSSSTTTTTSQQSESFEVRASSLEVKSNSFDVFSSKKDKEITAINTSVDNSNTSAKSTTKISITDNTSSVLTSSPIVAAAMKVEELSMRPTSVSLRNSSISPIPRTVQPMNHITKPSPTNISATHISSSFTSTNGSGGETNSRMSELEQRVVKLESLLTAQNSTIEELRRMLRDESDKVKTLKNDLEKYASCFTQDKKPTSKIFVNNNFKH